MTALGKIAAVGNAYTVHTLCKRIKDAHFYVRSAALSALTRVAVKGDPVAVAAVEDCLKTETWSKVRVYAHTALRAVAPDDCLAGDGGEDDAKGGGKGRGRGRNKPGRGGPPPANA